MAHQALWRPSEERIAAANLTAFMRDVNQRFDAGVQDYDALWRWSVDRRDQFWQAVWSFCGVIAQSQGETVLLDGERMPGSRWFPQARLNFAENLLRRQDDAVALVFEETEDMELVGEVADGRDLFEDVQEDDGEDRHLHERVDQAPQPSQQRSLVAGAEFPPGEQIQEVAMRGRSPDAHGPTITGRRVKSMPTGWLSHEPSAP